jgi:hypothetical protein
MIRDNTKIEQWSGVADATALLMMSFASSLDNGSAFTQTRTKLFVALSATWSDLLMQQMAAILFPPHGRLETLQILQMSCGTL